MKINEDDLLFEQLEALADLLLKDNPPARVYPNTPVDEDSQLIADNIKKYLTEVWETRKSMDKRLMEADDENKRG